MIVGDPAEAKPLEHPVNMQTLRDICAKKESVLTPGMPMVTFSPGEIPICGKTWWETADNGGETVQYECLMDKGHRESAFGKHGLRGMVRKIDG